MIGVKSSSCSSLDKTKKKFTPHISSLLESDLNLLECLLSYLILPQDLLEQFPDKYQERFSTGVTWYKNRTFVVNNWGSLFAKFQTSLTKMEKSIITNEENYLKYKLKQYANFKIVQHCHGDMYIVEEPFFQIYKQKIYQNLNKIELLSDKLPRTAASIHLMDDFQRKTNEKRKCLKVVRHMFEQGNDKGAEANVKSDPQANDKKTKRIINEGFDFARVKLPKLNTDSCVRLNNISKKIDLTGDILEIQQEKTRNEKLGDHLEIDFKQISSDIKVLSSFGDAQIHMLVNIAGDEMKDKQFDTAIVCGETVKEDDVDEELLLENSENKEALGILEESIQHSSDLNVPVERLETMEDIEDNIDEENLTEEDLQDWLMSEDSEDADSLISLNEKCSSYPTMSLSVSPDEKSGELTPVPEKTGNSSCLPEISDDATQVMENAVDTVQPEKAGYTNIALRELGDVAQELEKLSDTTQESDKTSDITEMLEISADNTLLLEMSAEISDDASRVSVISTEISSDTALVPEISGDTTQHPCDTPLVPEISGDTTEHPSDTPLVSEISGDTTQHPEISADTENFCDTTLVPDIAGDTAKVWQKACIVINVHFANDDSIDSIENVVELCDDTKVLNAPVKTHLAAETKILFCSWMKAPNDMAEETVEILIDYQQICADVALLSRLVNVELNPLSNKAMDREPENLARKCEPDVDLSEVIETKLSEEEEDLLKQEFLKSEKEEHCTVDINTSNGISLDLEVEEESAPIQTRMLLMKSPISNEYVEEYNEYCKDEEEDKEECKEEHKEECKEEDKEECKEEDKEECKEEDKEECKEEDKEEFQEENKEEFQEYKDEYKEEHKKEHKEEYKEELQKISENEPVLKKVKIIDNTDIIDGKPSRIAVKKSDQLASKMKIAESFDDMFKSFLRNPAKESGDEHNVYVVPKSEEQGSSVKNKQWVGRGVSQVLDELEMFGTTNTKVKLETEKDSNKLPVRKTRNTRAKATTGRGKALPKFDLKQEIADQTDLLPVAKKQLTAEVITLEDNSDDDTNPKPKPKVEPPTSNIVYVPQHARILHVPDRAQVVRVTTGTERGIRKEIQTNPKTRNAKHSPPGNKRLQQGNAKNINVAPNAKHASWPVVPTNISLNHSVLRSSAKPSPGLEIRTRTSSTGPVRRSANNIRPTQIVSLPFLTISNPKPVLTRSRQPPPPPVVKQALGRMSRTAPQKTELSSALKRKNQTETVQRRKSARLESDEKKKLEYVDNEEGNQQSELLEFISENILSKAEMKPHGQVSYIYHCNLCAFRNRSKWNLENHVESTHGDFDVAYQCDLCDFIAKTRANYYAHGKKKHNIHIEPQY